MNKNLIVAFALAVSGMACFAQAPPPPPPAASAPADPLVLRVGEEELTRSAFEALLAALPEEARAQAASAGAGKRRLAEQFIDIKVLAQEARRRKLDQDPVFQRQVALQIEQLLAGAAYQQVMKQAALSEAALRMFYDEHKADYERIRARHILIRYRGSPVSPREGAMDLSVEEALAKTQELHKKIRAGGDFAALAREESDDPGTRASGGDLGTFARGQLVADFDKVAFALEPGQLSEPFKTEFGYHIVEVQERSGRSYEEVRQEIAQREQTRRAAEAVRAMKQQANVFVDEAYFGVVVVR